MTLKSMDQKTDGLDLRRVRVDRGDPVSPSGQGEAGDTRAASRVEDILSRHAGQSGHHRARPDPDSEMGNSHDPEDEVLEPASSHRRGHPIGGSQGNRLLLCQHIPKRHPGLESLL